MARNNIALQFVSSKKLTSDSSYCVPNRTGGLCNQPDDSAVLTDDRSEISRAKSGPEDAWRGTEDDRSCREDEDGDVLREDAEEGDVPREDAEEGDVHHEDSEGDGEAVRLLKVWETGACLLEF